jgi:hypothetical protein
MIPPPHQRVGGLSKGDLCISHGVASSALRTKQGVFPNVAPKGGPMKVGFGPEAAIGIK